ncbi:hypothetical protein RS030_152319 [Cryptosporidium xiaoi]|uniref:Integral membrane protein n=1 Tax=Cryptosporidium xiaoi TaxID=659607 RepID=A0AAV9Y168_9CRYT
MEVEEEENPSSSKKETNCYISRDGRHIRWRHIKPLTATFLVLCSTIVYIGVKIVHERIEKRDGKNNDIKYLTGTIISRRNVNWLVICVSLKSNRKREAIFQRIGTLMSSISEAIETLNYEGSLTKRGLISTLVGIVLGVIVSVTVNATLVEISLSPFFSTYFGLLFVVIGGLIYWKVYVTVAHNEESGINKRKFLLIFSCLITLSGLICFLLENDWFIGTSPIVRVPVYTLLGLSVSFALAFSLVDVVNYLSGLIYSNDYPLLINSKAQIVFVVCSSLLIGVIFGFLFGLVEDSHEQIHYINISMMKQKYYCYVIGIFVGAFCGFGNEVIRMSDKSYMVVGKTVYDSEV